MPKRVATVSTTVVREGKRREVKANTSFDFTADEIKDLNAIHPGAIRKGVNETADEPTDATSPEKTVEPTANKANKTPAKKAAAQKDSTSDEATGNGDTSDSSEDDDI